MSHLIIFLTLWPDDGLASLPKDVRRKVIDACFPRTQRWLVALAMLVFALLIAVPAAMVSTGLVQEKTAVIGVFLGAYAAVFTVTDAWYGRVELPRKQKQLAEWVAQHSDSGKLTVCLSCGYSLQHLPSDCPECGEPTTRLRTVPSQAI